VHRTKANEDPDWTAGGVVWTSPQQSLYGCEGWLYAMALRLQHTVYGKWGSALYDANVNGRIAEWNSSQGEWIERIADYMDHLVSGQIKELERFWGGRLTQTGQTYFDPRVRIIVGQAQLCGSRSNPRDSFYCSRDHTVYLGRRLLELVLSRGGNVSPAIVLAHEWGHHIQFLMGILDSYNSKGVEIQADCFAGVYAADVERRGMFDVGDADNVAKLMFSIGDRDGLSPWFKPSAHGDGRERVAAFRVGVTEGISGCLKLR
jgi:predicted metalloprotease